MEDHPTSGRRKAVALFRYSIIASLVHRDLKRGELREELAHLAARNWRHPLTDQECRFSPRTIEQWFYIYKKTGFDGLLPQPRRDRGTSRALPLDVQPLILDMKREDPGRSAPLIEHELKESGLLDTKRSYRSAITRLLRAEGLSGPRKEAPPRRERLRWQVEHCGDLWQGDAVHGPALFNPASGRKIRVKVFALLDDRSRIIVYMRGSFDETQRAFLTVFLAAVLRRGRPRSLLLDNHGSFTGSDVRTTCAQLDVRLLHTRPNDGPAKGKIERFFRTFRAHFLDRLDLCKVTTLDDFNVRLAAYRERHYNVRPHAGLGGRTPRSVWEEDADNIRWIEDPVSVQKASQVAIERRVRADSTVQVGGVFYEVPAHLAGKTIPIYYDSLDPGRYWIIDAEAVIPIAEVDPLQNAKRRRNTGDSTESRSPSTGLNPVEDLLRRLTKKRKNKE